MDRDAYFDTFAISTRLFLRSSLGDALRRIGAAGFRWVELWASDGLHLDPRGELDLASTERLMAELGVRAHSVHTPFSGLELGHPERCDLGRAKAVIATAIDRAAALGATVAVVHPSTYEGPLDPALHARSRDQGRAIVESAVTAGERCGVRIAVENMVAVGYWRYGVSIAELVADLPDLRVGFCLDVGHASVQGLDVGEQVAAAGGRLVHLHVHDNDGTRDAHLPPLRGRIDWRGLDRALGAAGYRGRRVLEVAYRAGEEDRLLAETAGLWQRWPGGAMA